MSRWNFPASLVLAMLVAAAAGVAQEAEWWKSGGVDQWSPRLRRVAATETLREIAAAGTPEAKAVLDKVLRGLDATLADGFWRDDGRLSPWGLEYFETEEIIFGELEAGLESGLFEPAQESAIRTAFGYLLSADVELVQRGIEGSEDVLASLGCSDDSAGLNCAKVADKLEGQHLALAQAFSAMSSEKRLQAVDRLALSWKRSNKAERKYLAKKAEALEMVGRLAQAIDDQGCDMAQGTELRQCSEAEERLEQARVKLRRASRLPEDDERAIELYWGAWKVAWSALWQELPVGAGYIAAPVDRSGSRR